MPTPSIFPSNVIGLYSCQHVAILFWDVSFYFVRFGLAWVTMHKNHGCYSVDW
jgi:hypothetical protein